MAAVESFRDLLVWQRSIELSIAIYKPGIAHNYQLITTNCFWR